MGRAEGITEDELAEVATFRASGRFTAAEKAALAYAEEMTIRVPVEVPDAVFVEVRRHFDADAIVELTAMIALENFRARFNRALEVPSDGLCRLPADHPVLRVAASG